MGRSARDQGSTLDYNKQPLPLFGVWSNYGPSTYGLGIYDSDGQLVTASSVSNYAGLANSEFQNTAPYNRSNDGNYTSLSSTVLTTTGMFTKATGQISADGCSVLQASADGSYTPKAGNVTPYSQGYWGVVIGPEGYRQPMTLYQQGYNLKQMVRGGNLPLDAYTLVPADMTPAAATATATSPIQGVASTPVGQCGIGQIAYHRGLNKLVWLEPQDASGTLVRMHIWRNPNRKLTGRFGELRTFVKEAKAGVNGASYSYADFSWATPGATQESWWRCRLIPSNNDAVYAVARFLPGTRVEMGTVTVAGAVGTFAARPGGTIAATTSYGVETAGYCGMRHQLTWDNKWCAVFSQYYYYGCGMIGFIFNVDDPTQTYSINLAFSSDGVQILPFKQSAFIFGNSQMNSDSGGGMGTAVFDPSTGFQMDGTTALVNGAALTFNWSNYQFDVAYTSTHYPGIVPIERWVLPTGVAANG